MPGKYTLQVMLIGYKTMSQEITVEQDQIVQVKLQLEASDKQLKEVIVSGARNRYKNDSLSGSLRLRTPILEVPQNIQVISANVIADQQAFDLVDGITRNVSGATRVGHWDNQYANIRMRGSKIPAFRNGMNIEASWGPTAEDAAMIDRVEFVKGPAGFMLAGGEPGGFYNVVTKKPTGVTKGAASISMGSFSTYRAALDFDGKLSKDGKLLYRLNVAGQQKDYYTKYNFNNRYLFAPVLKYLVDDRTSVTLEYTYQGSTYLANGNYVFSKIKLLDEGISNDFFYGDPSLTPGKLKDHSVYLYFDHKINDKWEAHAQVAYFNFGMEANSIWASNIDSAGNMGRTFSVADEAGENRFAQASISGEEYTGTVRHRILAGVDMGNKKFWGDFRSLANIDMVGDKKFNVYNPVYSIPIGILPTIDRSQSVKTRAGGSNYVSSVNYTSAYIQDELGFFNNKLRLSLAGRFTYAETVGKTKALAIKDNVFTPRVGLSYSIDKSTTIYGLFDQSFVPVPGADSNQNAFKPIKGVDVEAGVKKEWFEGRWVASATVYRIARQNSLVSLNMKDSRGADVQEQLGETLTKGVEIDIAGEILPGLNATLNYAYTDSKISKESPTATTKTVGNITPNTATHITNAWLNYRIGKGVLNGFGVTGGIQWMADRYVGSATKVFSIPNYFRTDAGLNYVKGKYSIAVLVNNLLDNQQLLTAASIPTTSTGFYNYIVEARRNFRMTIGYRF
ncbi:TonB-dependent siderophore receptor [Chitinophaga ginsengisegetis]|nr:TonB-dependent siderophore receptor [Chitinophaga ginsengisegetis]MDR6565156.1 iron complex outermembrane receptor protein [Chitinophaga ginsengisegetis]MDR6644883.1 iron complex outermembrane receptor protein [Chitinophaga ginsengisegetis]MDR6652525.1 iron complex outermembrane receptor protein [Chitinophaga ginsengisegetis]